MYTIHPKKHPNKREPELHFPHYSNHPDQTLYTRGKNVTEPLNPSLIPCPMKDINRKSSPKGTIHMLRKFFIQRSLFPPDLWAQRIKDSHVLVSSKLRLTRPPGVSGIVSPLLLPPCRSPAASSSVSSSAASLLK